MSETRILAAILAAHVVRFSKLIGEDGDGAGGAGASRGGPSDNAQHELRVSPNRNLHRHDLQ